MPIADMLRLGTAKLTPQQIADFALQEDRMRRAAIRRGDLPSAHAHASERDELCREIGRA